MAGKYKELDMSGLKLSKTRDYAVYLALKSSGQGKGEKVLPSPVHPLLPPMLFLILHVGKKMWVISSNTVFPKTKNILHLF